MNSPICNRSESLLRQCRIKMPMTTQWPTMMATLPSGLTANFFQVMYIELCFLVILQKIKLNY